MDNTDYELVWRKKMVRPLVTAALREVRGDDVRELRQRIARQTLHAVATNSLVSHEAMKRTKVP